MTKYAPSSLPPINSQALAAGLPPSCAECTMIPPDNRDVAAPWSELL